MKKLAKKPYDLQAILDSDDELPTEYSEIPFVPAYLNDDRFEYIEECKKINKDLDEQNIVGNSSNIGQCLKEEPRLFKNVLNHGYLNKKDTFCFQCLESTMSDKTLLWFFDFLILKDLQSSYTFLKTCLVPYYDDNEYFIINSEFLNNCNEKNHSFKIVTNKM